MTSDQEQVLKVFEAAPVGTAITVQKRGMDWRFDFGSDFNVCTDAPWRIVTDDGIAFADEDDGQWFGLASPIDGNARVRDLVYGRVVETFQIDRLTADIFVRISGGVAIHVFCNSMGYESWVGVHQDGSRAVMVIAGGGGRLTVRMEGTA